jgi:membrane-anchored protein YejM (alkaline phosphatase superfamily)
MKFTPQQLRAEYREVANAPAPPNPPEYFGKARDYDVVLFVIETMPAACVSFDSSLKRFPNIATLNRAAWVGSAHNSTYPVTTRALFSILTGTYPPDSSSDMLTLGVSGNDGLIHSLNRAGYVTSAFGAGDSIVPLTREMFDRLGFKKIISFNTRPTMKETGTDVWARDQIELDRGALAALKQNMGQWIDHNQRYAALYLPQISHGPWTDLERGGQERDLMKRGQGLVVLLDQWLGEILAVLREKGRLGRTLIVVTADHGLRSWVEAPGLLKNLMDDYAFHVPFLLYAPGVLDHSRLISYVTSHIDLTPSILDLLGIAEGREMEHGGLLWDPRLESRRVYFWANRSNGMYDAGLFYGWNRTAEIVYSSPQMHFGANEVQPDNSAAYRRATESILRMDALRFAWFRSGQAAPR